MFERLQTRSILVPIVMATLLAAAGPATAEVVTFPDAGLEAEVRETLGIPTDPITDTDMETLGSLLASSRRIANIQGLEYGTNLHDLDLYHNQVRDISPIVGLTNLTDLDLHKNQISDVSPISSLDMSGVDFRDVFGLFLINTMDDLETLLFRGATYLDGSEVVALTVELDSLNRLDVTGPWDSFDAAEQNSLNAWGAIEGNTLVIPEPGSTALLVCGALGPLAYGWRRRAS